MSDFKPVVFKLGNEEYGVDINLVYGIENVMPIVPLSNVSPFIKGIINLRGNIVPVYSLRRKFNMGDVQYTEATKFVLVKTDDVTLALEVDSIGDIQNVTEQNLYDIPKIVIDKDTKYYDKVISLDKRIIVMINIEELLNEMEMNKLSEAIKKME